MLTPIQVGKNTCFCRNLRRKILPENAPNPPILAPNPYLGVRLGRAGLEARRKFSTFCATRKLRLPYLSPNCSCLAVTFSTQAADMMTIMTDARAGDDGEK